MLRRVSAIDIGSNAVRMIVAQIKSHSSEVKVLHRLRAPLRLGQDTYSLGRISPRAQRQTIATLLSFAEINNSLGVTECRAIATSAIRDADNRQDFLQRLFRSSGIKVQLIDGFQEAELAHKAIVHVLPHLQHCLLLDIGGGSVEISFSNGRRLLQSQSFPLGTVRLLQEMKKWHLPMSELPELIDKHLAFTFPFIYNNLKVTTPEIAVGSGGNMEALLKLKRQLFQAPKANHLDLQELSFINDILASMDPRERMQTLQLRPDRADVIYPASLLTEKIMRQAQLKKILVPKVGVRDGLIQDIIEDQRTSFTNHAPS